MADHGVAINTAQVAVRLLAAEGLVEIRPSSGAYVRERADSAPDTAGVQAELAEIREHIRQAKQDLGTAEKAVADLAARLQPGQPQG